MAMGTASSLTKRICSSQMPGGSASKPMMKPPETSMPFFWIASTASAGSTRRFWRLPAHSSELAAGVSSPMKTIDEVGRHHQIEKLLVARRGRCSLPSKA